MMGPFCGTLFLLASQLQLFSPIFAVDPKKSLPDLASLQEDLRLDQKQFDHLDTIIERNEQKMKEDTPTPSAEILSREAQKWAGYKSLNYASQKLLKLLDEQHVFTKGASDNIMVDTQQKTEDLLEAMALGRRIIPAILRHPAMELKQAHFAVDFKRQSELKFLTGNIATQKAMPKQFEEQERERLKHLNDQKVKLQEQQAKKSTKKRYIIFKLGDKTEKRAREAAAAAQLALVEDELLQIKTRIIVANTLILFEKALGLCPKLKELDGKDNKNQLDKEETKLRSLAVYEKMPGEKVT